MKSRRFQRFLEIIPGALTWVSLIAPIILSFFAPAIVAVFVIVFDLHWLYKATIMGVHLVVGYRRLRHDTHVDWMAKVESTKPDNLIADWKKIYHAMILTTYQEELDILRPSVQAVVDSSYPRKKVILVLATEERDKERARRCAKTLKEEFKDKFFAFLVTEHPDDIVGEVKAKGANATWAAKKLRKFLDEKKIAYEDVIVSTADADTRISHQYLSCLTFKYITNTNRLRRSFQPIPIYSNNIWDAPAICRIIAFGNSFWQIIEATRPWRLINFSTHAMSMRTLVDINYWSVNVVNEDSRQFWRAYFKFDGDHEVEPIFVPVHMDAVLADSYWLTIKNQYLQKKRWAYGVEHFPYVITQSIENKSINFWNKITKIWRLVEGNYSWATASIFIGVISWLPLTFGTAFKNTVLAANMPIVIRYLLGLTWFGIVVSVIISTLLLPPRPPKYRRHKHIEMVIQWILIPIQAILFGSFPAIDAQTKLMLGKYMTFRVTQKAAKK